MAYPTNDTLALGLPGLTLGNSQYVVNQVVANRQAEIAAAQAQADSETREAQIQAYLENVAANMASGYQNAQNSFFNNFLSQWSQQQPKTPVVNFGVRNPYSPGLPSLKTNTLPIVKPYRPPAPTPTAQAFSLPFSQAGEGVQPRGKLTAQMGYAGRAHNSNNKFGLQPAFWAALTAASKEMAKAGLGTIKVGNGFRSDATQAGLYNKPHRPGYVAKPGSSKHRTGFVADLQLTAAQQQWLYKNGRKFGIYAPMWNPVGKNRVQERWHWEFWGVPNLKI